ncbi:hypothetical protein JHK82_043613 [Glycine max]|nr:hypothetical protein JHK86_043500 [Glycine max]KAG4957780.1 hypothetical protein JHK85_044160 [Glycine max]KAG5106643.1 hypothetical protein JHK82_043613 [Glycine max]KAG5117572.1 hypothetical protein JHK84_043685 [Glycine max]
MAASPEPINFKVLLKVSREALAGDHSQNIDPKITMAIAREVAAVTRLGIEVTTMDSFMLVGVTSSVDPPELEVAD